jgi:surface carbohydrate biosynthesis protein
MNRIVYFPIEKASREFDPRMLLACELLRDNVSVVLGMSRGIFGGAVSFPAGYMYFKGLNKVQYQYMKNMPALGHGCVGIDEESLGSCEGWFTVNDCWRDVQPLVHKIFCNGRAHKDALQAHREFSSEQLVVSGNSRIDLLRSPFLEEVRRRAREIRQENGNFILINTDMGLLNGPSKSIDKYLETLDQIGWIDQELDGEFLNECIVHDAVNLRVVSQYVEYMDKWAPNIRLILRPHPSEDAFHWKALAGAVSNLTVVERSNPLEWMLASAGLVHLGCTTGVEAAVLDIPRIGLVPKVPTTRIPRVRLSNLVSAIIRTPEEAARASRDLIEERGAFFAFPWQKSRGVLDAYLAGLEGEYAFQKIARSITTDLPDHDSNTRDVPSPISGRVDEELRKVVTKTTFEDAHVERSHLESKRPKFSMGVS